MTNDSRRVMHDASEPGPQIGDRAPDFELRHTFERKVSLDDLVERGRVVLCFYVFDFGDI